MVLVAGRTERGALARDRRGRVRLSESQPVRIHSSLFDQHDISILSYFMAIELET